MDIESVCGNCGETVTETIYKEEIHTVEEHYDCHNCGYRYHWAYGLLLPESTDYPED